MLLQSTTLGKGWFDTTRASIVACCVRPTLAIMEESVQFLKCHSQTEKKSLKPMTIQSLDQLTVV
jgi:hypothetical protein